MADRRLGLFEGFGVELEYMIVADRTLNVLPVCDRVIEAARREIGEPLDDSHPGDVDFGELAWSNELALHVLEMKTAAPAPRLEGLADRFQASVRLAQALLAPLQARLLSGGMHPWMDPYREMRLWPHEYGPVYRLLDEIFDCTGHGWANLQSVHLNLPFADDEEFGRLHAAIRLLLPILPALAASSPVMDGAVNGRADNRLHVYRFNSARLPILTGAVIPEQVFTEEHYNRVIYDAINTALAPYDTSGILNHVWMNARGAIARFDRGAIEIRVLDIQERPAADLAVLAVVVEAVKALVSERWCDLETQQSWAVEPLHHVLLECIDHAEEAMIDHAPYLSVFGMSATRATARDLWRHVINAAPPPAEFAPAIELILAQGTLSRRLTTALGADPDPERLETVFRQLASCLERGEAFDVSAFR